MATCTTSHTLPTQPTHYGTYRRLKVNVVVLDGANLHNSKVLEWQPIPAGRPVVYDDDDSTWGGRHSWMLREVLDFVFRSDSRFYGRRHAVLTEDYREQLRLYQNPSNFSRRRHMTYVIEQTIWFVVTAQYRFQVDNMYNQMEDVCVHILNICMREVRREAFVIGPHILYLAVREYHNRLFANYFKWCDYLGENPFPWEHPPWLENSFCSEDAVEDTPLTSVTVIKAEERKSGCNEIFPPATRRDMQKMTYEIALFKLLWGEAFNLRHMPEFLCWIFHWLCLAWNPTFTAEENFVDLIRDVLQRTRDEQCAPRSLDHCSRLLYDDINEVFWERESIRLLKRAKENTEKLYSVQRPSAQEEAQAHHDGVGGSDENACSNSYTRRKKDDYLRVEVTRENLNMFVERLLYASEPGKGIKTFLERRTYLQHVPVYLQVLRSFWRVFAWQYVSFAFLFYLRAFIDDEPADVLSTCWNRALFTAVTVHAIEPFLDLLLANWRALRKKHFWRFFLQENILNVLRLGFFSTTLAIVFLEGLQSSLFSWKGMMGAAYSVFYLVHGLHYFLFVRISGSMPFFHFLWKLPLINSIAKPATFTGNTPLLAEDLTHVVKYVLFWVPIVALKLAYWIFLVVPELQEAGKHIEAAAARPFLVGPMAMSFEENPVVLRLVLWTPALLLWVFDLQIFFILSGAVYGSLEGCWRRVGFFKSTRKIQKRLLPVLSSVPIFEPSAIYKSENELEDSKCTTLAFSNVNRRKNLNGSAVEGAYSRAESAHVDNGTSMQGSSTLQRTGTKIQYQNCTDPYKNMVPLLGTKSLATRLLPGLSVDETAVARKRFGFLWNEVVYSWRQEDIISNAELGLLLFNELPLIDIPNDDWSVTRLDRKQTFIRWEKSTFRLPVYCYCDVVLGFLKKCELFHYQVKDEMARFSSRKAAAINFFREHVSDDPHHQDPRFKDSLHIDAGAEIAEALFLYLSRYFEKGVDLVDAIVDLWNWVKQDGSRLLWISMISLKELAIVLEQLFTILQSCGTWGEKEHARLERVNVMLEQRLSVLIELPTDDPVAAENETLPEVIKEYLSSIKICFSSLRTGFFPSVYPQPVEVEEVNAMIRYLQIVMSHTRQLHIVEHGDIEEGRKLLPMTTEQMAEARCLHNLLSKADADVVVGGRLEQGDFSKGAVARKQLGQVEYAVKLYFRRAARILRATNPFLATPEADRRLKQFANSLLMKMPGSPEVHKMISMVTLTPYYREDTVLDVQDLERPTEEGVSKMELLRSLHPQELEHFLERVDRDKDMFTIHQELENRVADSPFERKQAIREVRRQMQQNGLLERYDRFSEALQEWASYRGQVLMRTVRGMMYHEHAIKMQAYLEQMSYANLHLCHDLNRLDFEQLKVLNSPESGLWEEVLTVPPAYELCPVVTAMAKLKYQYVVAAQEFGTDIVTQPSRETATTGEARSRLLRKLWMHKILFRYPSLRVATVEAERDNRGVPTGYKVGKLYRLSTTPDCLRQYVCTPKLYVPRAPTHASTYQRQVDLGPTEAAEMPKPHAKHLHMQFDPDDGSNLSENFTLNTRSGGKSSSSASEKDAEDCTSSGKKKQQREEDGEAGVQRGRHLVAADFTSKVKEGSPFDMGFPRQAQDNGEHGLVLREQRVRPRSSQDRNAAGYDAVQPDTSGDDSSKRTRQPTRKHKHVPFFTASSCGGTFQADVANLIQKTHQRRAKDQQAAASMHRLVRRMTGKDVPFSSEICSDHTLRLGTSRESEAFGAGRRLVATRNAPTHSAAPGSGSLREYSSWHRAVPATSLHSTATTEVDYVAAWWDHDQVGWSESPGLTPTQYSYLDDDGSTVECSSEDDITEFSGYVEDALLTPLACQHTRELARDRNSVVAWKLAGADLSAVGGCGLLQGRPASGIQHVRASGVTCTCNGEGDKVCSQSIDSRAHASFPYASVQRHTIEQRRRHSIVTLHPVEQAPRRSAGDDLLLGKNISDIGKIRNVPRFMRPRKMLHQGQLEQKERVDALEEHPSEWENDRLVGSRRSRRFYIDGVHAIEPLHSSSQVRGGLSCGRIVEEPVRHFSNCVVSPEQQKNVTSSAQSCRRSSVDETVRPDSPLAFARRVAMFEEYFKRNKNNEVYARLYKRTAQRGRRALRRHKPLIWLSNRGPMGLQAIYTLRLPLIVDEDKQPWDKFPFIGPGKPENQNHAMAFTRMETLQVVDMNMEGYLEEALKLRNLLQEFVAHPRMRILGFREHIFTENVSSLASFMALQENVFTTTNQRLYHEPLQVRMHYGHPDIFDRFFVQTCGSCSKSSKQLHLSEDVFAGFNCTARGYSVRHVDYIQCGKGRDVGLHQVVMFERKVAGGNAEQMLSRDVCRMAKNMDFFRLLSLYFSGPGFFFGAVILFLAAYVTLYVKCFFSFSQYKYKGVTESALQYVMAPTTYVQFQLGFLLLLPLLVWLLAEKGLWIAISRMVDLVLKFAVAYYNFMIGTKAMIIDHVLLYGGARYQETGRGFVVTHMSLRELWQLYYFTHFSVGLEMTFLLVVYARFCGFNAGVYFLDTWPLFLMAFSLLYVPFLYNPLGMYYPRLLEDITGWRQWMSSRDLRDEKASWFAWWRAEMEGRCNIAWHHQLILTVRLMRFLIISVGMVSCVAMTIKTSDMDCVVYLFGTAGCSLFLIIFLDDLKLASPNWNTALSVIICLAGAFVTGWLLLTGRITLSVLITASTAFLVFSYGLLEISFVILGRWAVRNDVLAEAARAFHYLGGFFVFSVPVLLAGFTLSFHKIQTRILFNPRFATIVKSGLVQRAEVTKKGHLKK